MKKFLVFIFLLSSFNFTFAAVIENTDDSKVDDSIINQLENNTVKSMNSDFSLKSFESCEDLETIMDKYIKSYWEKNKSRYNYGGGIMYKGDIMYTDDIVFNSESSVNNLAAESIKSDSQVDGIGGGEDFSKTNIQVAGVDESDIVKTDGKYIYYYNDSDKYVYIVKTGSLEVIKKITIPKNFYSPVLYIANNRLVIVSSGYSNAYVGDYYWINRNSKSYVIVYDTSDINNLSLKKLYISDGDLTKSRLIGDYLYIISNNNFNIPYYNFKSIDDINVKASNLIPKSIELTKTDILENQNLKIKQKNLPYNLKAGNVASCSEIEYVLQDEETLAEYDFSPSYNIISVININDTDEEIEKKVIAGSNNEIFMSLDNLYLTSYIYRNYDYKCSNDYCIAPWYPRGQNTLVHQINVSKNDLKYSKSTIIPGSPLNQYSMDQNGDNFRIITSTNYPELSTNLYILDKQNLDLVGNLTSIQPGEEFKSSRFIGDKLFLVTFQRTDPLFVIDLSDRENPKILGELKIPGYSTYLHPYDDNHLIGIGYDTKENDWGGIINSGVKIDLYQVNYDKKCGDNNLNLEEKDKCDLGEYKGIIIKQLATKTFGGYRTNSEALNNPRMFMWKQSENKLFLPIEIYENSEDDLYTITDFFQGLLTINIDLDNGISEDNRLTHIDLSQLYKQREEECSKYTKESLEKKCVKLIGGGEYCEGVKYNSVPKYCYSTSNIGEYLGSKSWNYRNNYIKRALWIGNDVYSISNAKISISDMDKGNVKISGDLK